MPSDTKLTLGIANSAPGATIETGSQAGPVAVGFVLRLPQNQDGRDFVVGDIHGAYDLVVAALRRVRFDTAVDRLICAGDLIDRGPDSWRCLRFLRQPYVFAVRGNHDDAFAEVFINEDPPEQAWAYLDRIYKTGWARDINAVTRRDIAGALAALPLAIELQTERGTVGIVHGDVPQGWDWQRFTAALEAGDNVARESALNGRQRVLSASQDGVPGIGRIFVGHTPREGGVRRYGNVYAMDTGAIFHVLKGHEDMGLTLADVCTGTSSLAVPEDSARAFDAGVHAAFENNTDAPFGNYVRQLQRG